MDNVFLGELIKSLKSSLGKKHGGPNYELLTFVTLMLFVVVRVLEFKLKSLLDPSNFLDLRCDSIYVNGNEELFSGDSSFLLWPGATLLLLLTLVCDCSKSNFESTLFREKIRLAILATLISQLFPKFNIVVSLPSSELIQLEKVFELNSSSCGAISRT